MRQQVSGNVPAEAAERMSDTGSDYTVAEEILIDKRVDALLDEWLYSDDERFADLMCAATSTSIDHDLQRALKNLDAACNGDEISRTACLTALSNIQKQMKGHARETFATEAREQAENELNAGEL